MIATLLALSLVGQAAAQPEPAPSPTAAEASTAPARTPEPDTALASPAEPAPATDVPLAAAAPPPTDASAAPPTDAAAAGTEKRDVVPKFIKGELSTYLGADRLVVKNTRIGVSAGIDRFGDTYYLLVEPLVDLRFLDAKLGLGFGVPLRIELVSLEMDPATGNPKLTQNIGRIRKEDWDSFHDFGRILKYVTYGKKEDPLYVSVGQRYASSIGHGAITRRYSPNIDIDYPRVSAEVDAYNRFGGFELMVNDVLAWNQLSGIAFLKPLSFFNPAGEAARSFSIGVSGGLDWAAPYNLVVMDGLRQLDDQHRLITENKPVGIVGIDAEVKVVKTEHVDLKPYVDFSMLVGGDFGVTGGLLGRFNVGQETVNAFRVVVEARYLGSRYAPSYFDTFYEVDRFVFRELPRVDPAVANYVPKQRYLLENGLGQRFGYYLEGSWGIPGAVGLTLALQGVSNSPATDFVAHLEVPVLSFFQIFGSYYLRGVESWSELGFQADQGVLGLFGNKAIAFAGARLKILPFLFINGRLYKTFRMNPDLKRYDNQVGFVVDVEIGYEFRKKTEMRPPNASAFGASARSAYAER
ncbi:MAG: hypothetical protein AB1730_21235 [Myxococcota bacterium]